MISQTHRFHGRTSLNRAYRSGQVARAQNISIKYVKNYKRRTYRVAVVVSRKVHKSAVKRNRIRRRIYEIVRTLGPGITQPYDIVFVIYSDDFADMEYAKLQDVIQSLLKRAGLLAN